nr:15297_t:CDS:2 [Entrophospora candida]
MSNMFEDIPIITDFTKVLNDNNERENLPLRFIWNVENNLTETVWWPSSNNNSNSNSDNDEKIVFFMITGNPGLINYYTEFLSTIHNERNKNIDIIGVSNLGHFHGPHNSKLEGLYSLQDQINHKIQCFDKLHEKFSNNGKNNSKVKFVLCGHSIGAHICSQTRPNSNIEHVYALFPTLQHIQKTPNGTMLSFLFAENTRNLASSFVHSLRCILHPQILRYVVKLFTFQSDPHLSITTNQLLHGHVVKNSLYMANSEMEIVKDLEEELFKQHLNKFVFYFADGDNWAPLAHYHDMVRRFPDAKIHLCDLKLPHAFVIGIC